MDSVKLFVTDLDGTLLRDDHLTVSPRTRDALAALKARGVKLCACTGRLLSMMPPAVEEIGFDYAISSNGASCIDLNTRKHIFTAYMSEEKARFAWEHIRVCDCMTEWFVRDELLLDRNVFSQWETRLTPKWHRLYLRQGKGIVVEDIGEFLAQGAPGLEKIGVLDYPKELEELVIGPMRETGGYEISTSLGTNFEITDIAADKGRALASLCRYTGIDIADTIAFGDGLNDLALIKTAGTAVIMGNAMPGLKSLGSIFTDTNEEDGVAAYIEKHLL